MSEQTSPNDRPRQNPARLKEASEMEHDYFELPYAIGAQYHWCKRCGVLKGVNNGVTLYFAPGDRSSPDPMECIPFTATPPKTETAPASAGGTERR